MFTELYRPQQLLVASHVNLLIVCCLCVSCLSISYLEHVKFVVRLRKGHPEGTIFRILLFFQPYWMILLVSRDILGLMEAGWEDTWVTTRPLTSSRGSSCSYVTPGRIGLKATLEDDPVNGRLNERFSHVCILHPDVPLTNAPSKFN